MSIARYLSKLGALLNSNGQVQTAGIADANITIPKLSATGTPSSTTYLRGDNTWGVVTSNPGTVTSIIAGGGLTGGTITGSGTIAIDTTTYAIGQIISGRANNTTTTHTIGSTIAGSSLYSCPPSASNGGGTWGLTGVGVTISPTLVNVGTWKAITTGNSAMTGTCTQVGLPALWVRIS